MTNKLSILLALMLVGCKQLNEHPGQSMTPQSAVLSVSVPAGFSVVEQHPDGYFIRLASAERAPSATIHSLASSFNGKFDRVDLCLDDAHERGDEYVSIIGNQVFDHENDTIYSANL